MRLAPAAVLTALALVAATPLAACGTDSEPQSEKTKSAEESTIPGGADPESVQVIDEWARTLAEGDVGGAAELFAIPSVAQNSAVIVEIEERADARLFNASLPCGAKLERAETAGGFTVATFRLIERPGPGSCGAGTGETAQTAFRIENGAITEWRRVVPTDQEATGTPS